MAVQQMISESIFRQMFDYFLYPRDIFFMHVTEIESKDMKF